MDGPNFGLSKLLSLSIFGIVSIFDFLYFLKLCTVFIRPFSYFVRFKSLFIFSSLPSVVTLCHTLAWANFIIVDFGVFSVSTRDPTIQIIVTTSNDNKECFPNKVTSVWQPCVPILLFILVCSVKCRYIEIFFIAAKAI